jgi:uncharacterized protein YbjT (DUF2867 family)
VGAKRKIFLNLHVQQNNVKNMSGKIATLIGATGLVGTELLQQLLEDPEFEHVRILLRRPVPLDHPKLQKKLVDFNDNDSLLIALDGTDALFVAVGTTQRQVSGDKAAYRKVDFDIPVHAARLGKIVGCHIIVVVSAIGADSNSGNFYLRLKGEMEKAVRESGLEQVYMMRPSMLTGHRKEKRPLETIITPLMKAFSFLIPARYRAIEARRVAAAMIAAAKSGKKGFFVYTYEEMKKTQASDLSR